MMSSNVCTAVIANFHVALLKEANYSNSTPNTKARFYNSHKPEILAMAVFYWVLFLVGFSGNVGVLVLMSSLKLKQKRKRGGSSRTVENAFTYIFALCAVDLVVLLCVPIAIVDMMLGRWPFGDVVCKAYMFLESTSKVMSTFILAALSFERFCGVIYPTKRHLRSTKTSFTILFVLMGVATVILMPLPYLAQVETIDNESPVMETAPTTKCLTYHMSDFVYEAFTWTTFLLGFLIPIVAILGLSAAVLCKLARHQKTSSAPSAISLRRVVWYTIAICSLYCFCWLPYWIGHIQIYVAHTETDDHTDEQGSAYIVVMYFVHALPVMNSALNWVLYGLLNTQLRRLHQTICDDRAATNKLTSVARKGVCSCTCPVDADPTTCRTACGMVSNSVEAPLLARQTNETLVTDYQAIAKEMLCITSTL